MKHGAFAARARENLVRALRRDIRLLLPADPGRDRLLEYVRLFNPDARPATAGRIDVGNSREVYLTRVSEIGPDVAAEAGVPAGIAAAFFVQNLTRGEPFSLSGPQNSKGELYESSVRLVNGLGVRLNGTAWPEADALGEPLRATVYTAGTISAEQVYETAARYAPRLAPYADPSLGSINVSTWRTEDGQFEAQHWPRGTVSLLLPHEPPAIGDLSLRTSELTGVRLQLPVPAKLADPETAMLLAECALETAAACGGVCADQLGFRLRQPRDLVFG
jgi:hypothetical protein